MCKYFFNIINHCNDCFFLPNKIFFYKWLWKLYIFFNIKKLITIVLVDKKVILNLNKKFRNKECVTDILTFVYKFNIKINYLGEIIISPLVILKKSFSSNINYFFYFSYLLIHGLLHILGFNHNTYLNFKIMRKLEYFFLFSLKKIYFYENLLNN